MSSGRKRSVAVVVAATLVTVTTLLFGALATTRYVYDRRTEETRLRQGIEAQADELAAALAWPVWNIDRGQIDKILESQAETPQVEAVVIEAAGKIQARARDPQGRLVPSNGNVSRDGLLTVERAVNFSGERIGTVRLFATPRYVQQQLRDSLMSMVLTTLAVDLMLILSVYLVLWRSVLQPLTEIEKYAVAVSKGGTRRDVPRVAAGFTEELESLRSCIETMVRQLDHRYAELLEQEAFTNTAINTIGGIFFVQDIEGRFIRWNDTLERLAGGEQLLVDRAARTLVHPGDREQVNRRIADVFAVGQAEVETRLVLGTDVKNYTFSARRMDVGGQPFLVATGVDITERRQAEAAQRRLQEAVERSAAEWKETFDTVTTPILITERTGGVVRVNHATLELSGLSEEEIEGKHMEEIGAGEPWQTAAQLVAYIAGERQGTTAETTDADGRTWDIIVSRFSAPNGSERFILVLWEITGFIELQESLRRSETMSAMGTLVAGVAHEVRNPLFGISATLDAFHEELSQPGYAECASTLRQEVNRLIHLMQELLEYGKPPALTIERGDISDVIRQAVVSRLPSALAAQVEIRDGMTHSMPMLLMDRSRMRQVFENLVENAIQHSDRGNTVRISSALADHAGRHWVECTVDDEGPGFAPEDFDRVFEPFFTQREGGTGLGLSIVQRIVEEHSGKVFASNRPEGGGRIRVLFPLADDGTSSAKSTPA
jgi:PAS domain S-box-containing protein